MKKFNVAVVDSNFSQRRETLAALGEYSRKSGLPITADWYNSGKGLLDEVKIKGGYDIYIIDPILADLNGIQIVHMLRREDDDGFVIFYSKNLSYAYSAFEVGAYDYIAKTKNYDRLYNTLDSICEKIINNTVPPKIKLEIRTGFIRVPVDDISHIDIVNRALCYHMIDGNTYMSKCLRGGFRDAIGPFLDQPWFVMGGAGLIINVSCVLIINSRHVIMRNGEKVPITRRTYPLIHKIWREQK